MPSKKPSMIEAMRAKHDPHYQLAGKVEDLEKNLPRELNQLHKTLSKSFALQGKTLKRVIGLEKIISTADKGGSLVASEAEESEVFAGEGIEEGTRGGINGESFLGADEYEKYSTELQQSGTIAGRQLSPQERKEGFKKRKNKVDFKKFVGKVVSKKGGSGGSADGKKTALGKQKLLPGTKGVEKDVDAISKDSEAEAEGDKAKIDEDKKDPRVQEILNFLNTVLDSSLTKIENNLEKILGNFEDQIDANKDKSDALKDDASDDALADREAKLEGGGKKKSIMAKAADKVIEPVQGLFQTILNFITNVLLGGIVMKVLDIISNPLKLLDPFINIINGVSIALNAVIKAVHWIATRPLALLRSAFNLGINIWTKAINKALKLLPMVDFQIPEFVLPEIPGAPQIPMIPSGDEIKSKFSGEPAAVQGMAGGGLVTNVTNFLPGYSGGGEVAGNIDKSHYGTAGYRIGQVNPPTLVLSRTSFTSKAAETFGKGGGADYDTFSEDVDMNMPGRTREVMKYKSGDLIGKETFEEDIAAIGVPDLLEHKDQLLASINAVQGYEDVNIDDVINRKVNMPLKDYIPILMNSDAQAATFAKMDAAHNMDLQSRGITDPSKGYSMYNKGGKVPGSGTGDTVPAMLTPGEFVMSKGAVNKIGVENLMQMNAAGGGTNQPSLMKVKGYAGGGKVEPGPPNSGGNTTVVGAPARAGGGGSASGGGSAGDRGGVTRFSSTDHRNPSTLVVKSIYNVVQG